MAGSLLLSACETKTTKTVHRAIDRTLSSASWNATIDTPDGPATFDVQHAPVARVHLTGTADGRPYETFIDDRVYVTTAKDRTDAFIGFVTPCPGRTQAAVALFTSLMSMDLVTSASYTASETGYDAVLAGNRGRIHVDISDGLLQSVRFYGAPTLVTSISFHSVSARPAIELPSEDTITYPAIGARSVPSDQQDTIRLLGQLASCSR